MKETIMTTLSRQKAWNYIFSSHVPGNFFTFNHILITTKKEITA